MNKYMLFLVILAIGTIISAQNPIVSAQGSLPTEDAMKEAFKSIAVQESSLSKAVTMPLDKAMIKQGLELLPPEEIEEALASYVNGIVFIYELPRQIMVVMEFKELRSAANFLVFEEKVLRKKDETYKSFIVESDYKSYPEEKIFVSRKTVSSMGTTQKVTVIISVSGTYVLEANFLEGEYSDDEMKLYAADVWNAIETAK